MDLTTWMTDHAEILGSKNLKEIFIPGTHDSATYKLGYTVAKEQSIPRSLNIAKYFGIGFLILKIVQNWAKAQKWSIREQLENGIRFFDIRTVYRDSKKKFYTVHGVFGIPLDEVFDELAAFMVAHPKEIIIIQISHVDYVGESSLNDIYHNLSQRFQEKLVLNIETEYSLNELWSIGRQLLVYFDNTDRYGIVPEYRLNSYWADADDISDLKTKLDQNLQSNYDDDHCNFVIQSQLTPQTATIAKNLCGSLEGMAEKVSNELSSWLPDWANYPSIIISDFPKINHIEEIVNLNF